MAAKSNIFIDQGATFSTTLNITDSAGDPVDITYYTITAKLKKWYTSNTCTSFEVVVPNPTTGAFTLRLSGNVTGNLVAGRYVYDVKSYDSVSAEYTRIVEGIATINPAVS